MFKRSLNCSRLVASAIGIVAIGSGGFLLADADAQDQLSPRLREPPLSPRLQGNLPAAQSQDEQLSPRLHGKPPAAPSNEEQLSPRLQELPLGPRLQQETLTPRLQTIRTSELPAGGLWREMALADIEFVQKTLDAEYIYAFVPGGEEWKKQLVASTNQALADAERVTNFSTYQATLRRYADSFHDAHLWIHLGVEQGSVNWPQFLVRYKNSRYVVAGSAVKDLPDGSIITSCDGVAMDALVDKIAPQLGRAMPFEGRGIGLDATRDAMAKSLFVDVKSPFYARPAQCKIGNKDVTLQWQPISPRQLAKRNEEQSVALDRDTRITSFGKNSAWVRMPEFSPSSPQSAAQFHAIIDQAAELRDKDVVVFDVRGNMGGPYNWFMGFLREFYGPEYSSYYARARLEIKPVLLGYDDNAGASAAPAGRGQDDADPFNTPADPDLDAAVAKISKKVINGRTLTVMEPAKPWPKRAARPPVNPVKAKVYLLTDYGCGSACISFTDEMRRFPGVKQIGRETAVDSRSGTSKPFPLPSGNGMIAVPTMVRVGRERGDNIPWKPDVRFDGDIADTSALKAWVLNLAQSR